MNRKDWEDQVKRSDLNPTARLICLVIGSHGNWTEDREVWPSIKCIADEAGMSRETVGSYITALQDQGWLKHVRTMKYNQRVWELQKTDVDPSNILAKTNRGNQFTKLSTEPTTKKDVVVDQSNNLDELVVDTSDSKLSEQAVKLSEQAGLVVDSPSTNLKEPTTKNTKVEHKQEDDPFLISKEVPPAPEVAGNDSYLKRKSPSVIKEKKDEVASYLRHLESCIIRERLDEEHAQVAREMYNDSTWEPRATGLQRGALAVMMAKPSLPERIKKDEDTW